MKVHKMTELALLTELALIIFVVELRLPSLMSFPGMKLGLANIITVFAAYHYRAGETAMVVYIRIRMGSFRKGALL